MSELFSIVPFSFWAVIFLIAVGAIWALLQIEGGTGIPTLAVLVTVSVWYLGDAFYNDYANNHARIFTPEVLSDSWWEVVWFLLVFLVLVPVFHRQLNAQYLRYPSGVLQMYKHSTNYPEFQKQLQLLFKGSMGIWMLLLLLAALRLKGEVLHYLFPFIGYKAEPWGRDRIGGGIDALLTLAFYFQLLTASVFGVAAALFTNRRLQIQALIFCGLAWPYFLLDRTRNTMLAAIIPGILCWGLLRIRGNVLKKAAALAICFVFVNAWMSFIIANRSTMSISSAFKEKGFHLKNEDAKAHHEGLNMFEELCWVNTLVGNGTYHPNWGARYFAELVNPIPRVLWPGKPLIGIDYAIARGQGGGSAAGAGVNATISTGLIGQGVANFGRVVGPAFAAMLMALWVVLLAHLDLTAFKTGHFLLYAVGIFETFNVGRDISFLALYPFVFGAVSIALLKRWQQNNTAPPRPVNPRSPEISARPQAMRNLGRHPLVKPPSQP